MVSVEKQCLNFSTIGALVLIDYIHHLQSYLLEQTPLNLGDWFQRYGQLKGCKNKGKQIICFVWLYRGLSFSLEGGPKFTKSQHQYNCNPPISATKILWPPPPPPTIPYPLNRLQLWSSCDSLHFGHKHYTTPLFFLPKIMTPVYLGPASSEENDSPLSLSFGITEHASPMHHHCEETW